MKHNYGVHVELAEWLVRRAPERMYQNGCTENILFAFRRCDWLEQLREYAASDEIFLFILLPPFYLIPNYTHTLKKSSSLRIHYKPTTASNLDPMSRCPA